jgi:hypothetical protein
MKVQKMLNIFQKEPNNIETIIEIVGSSKLKINKKIAHGLRDLLNCCNYFCIC